MVRPQGKIQLVDTEIAGGSERLPRVNLVDRAYQRIEELLVDCTLMPGRFLTTQDLQDITGFGRTPVHHAVNRLSADTLIRIRPRHGLQISPIDLSRERALLTLRRDTERFVIQLATERADEENLKRLRALETTVRERRDTLKLSEFNVIDHEIDKVILAAANEPFVEHTLRPLHTLCRRIGHIYHTSLAGKPDLHKTVDHHLAVLEAMANRRARKAVAASEALIDFVDGMFDVIENEIEPALLDCSAAASTGPVTTLRRPINPGVRTGIQQRTLS